MRETRLAAVPMAISGAVSAFFDIVYWLERKDGVRGVDVSNGIIYCGLIDTDTSLIRRNIILKKGRNPLSENL